MITYEVDRTLPTLKGVKYIVSNTAVGFEWQPVARDGLDGINIYRSEPTPYSVPSSTKELTKIATVSSPFASHFVDTNLKQNSYYTYTFTTIKGGRESLHGEVLEVKTLPPLPKITFFKGAQKAKNLIKLLWRPHPDKRVKEYVIERSVNGDRWVRVGRVYNRMMVEFLDRFIVSGNRYQYRVFAVGFDGSYSMPSNTLTIVAR
jgi:fibronectin type 3 domain-containing protein